MKMFKKYMRRIGLIAMLPFVPVVAVLSFFFDEPETTVREVKEFPAGWLKCWKE